jgi:hypothetical protein
VRLKEKATECCSPADDGDENYTNRGPSRASIIRFASVTISSVRLFSRLEGLSANARVDPGAKIAALQPFPTELTSIRYPLYSITVIACDTYYESLPKLYGCYEPGGINE